MEKSNFYLSIQNVTKTYPSGVKALNNVSLIIKPGMYGLLGPNGAGKSTLMRILSTLQEPDEGQILLGNINVVSQKQEIRQTLGYLPQDFGLLKKVSAEKLLDHFVILKGVTSKPSRKNLVEELLRQTNLWDNRKQKLGDFSGGMRQRFGVAVALIGNPKLMIVDEPTAGLDPAERVRFLNLLSELGENSVVILSTHIVEDVAELCTNMAIINKGEILLETNPSQAIQSLKGLIWQKSIEKETLQSWVEEFKVISTKQQDGRIIIHIYCDEDPGNGFELSDPDLKDVYFSTIGGHFVNSLSQQKEGYAL